MSLLFHKTTPDLLHANRGIRFIYLSHESLVET